MGTASNDLEISRSLGRLEGKLDQILAQMEQQTERVDKRLDSHSSRIDDLEHQRTKLVSILGVFTVVGAGAWELLLRYFK